MRQIVEQENAATWIAEDDDRMFGFGIVDWNEETAGIAAYVQTLEVLPEFRGQGVGGELLWQLERSAREAGAVAIGLHVDAENSAAIRVYERSGYRKSGTEPDYYGRGQAGLVFEKCWRRGVKFPLLN
jgi:ribosomal protein S18 acetylase RimI-like enzyme